MKCSNCGSELNAEVKFCGKCGVAVTQEIVKPIQNESPSVGEELNGYKKVQDPQPPKKNIPPISGGHLLKGLIYPFKSYGLSGLLFAFIQLFIPIINYRVTGYSVSIMRHVGSGNSLGLKWKGAEKKIRVGFGVFLMSLVYSLPAMLIIQFVERKAYIGSISSKALFQLGISLGVLLFIICIYHFPMALVHYAVEGKMRSVLNIKMINKLIRTKRVAYTITVVLTSIMFIGIQIIGYVQQAYYFIIVPLLILYGTAVMSYWFGHLYYQSRIELQGTNYKPKANMNFATMMCLILSALLTINTVLTPVSLGINLSELSGDPQIEMPFDSKNRQEKQDAINQHRKGNITDAELNEVFDDHSRRVRESGSGSTDYTKEEIDAMGFWLDKASNYIPGVNVYVGGTKTILKGADTIDNITKIRIDDFLNLGNSSKNNAIKKSVDSFKAFLWEATKTGANAMTPGMGSFISGLAHVENAVDVAERLELGKLSAGVTPLGMVNPYNSPIFWKGLEVERNKKNNSSNYDSGEDKKKNTESTQTSQGESTEEEQTEIEEEPIVEAILTNISGTWSGSTYITSIPEDFDLDACGTVTTISLEELKDIPFKTTLTLSGSDGLYNGTLTVYISEEDEPGISAVTLTQKSKTIYELSSEGGAGDFTLTQGNSPTLSMATNMSIFGIKMNLTKVGD